MTKKLSKNQIEDAIQTLDQLHYLRLNCDGYDITLRISRLKMRLIIAIYVNDVMDYQWVTRPDQYVESKFFRSSFKSIYSTAQKNRLRKIYGQQHVKTAIPNLDQKIEYKVPYFNTAFAAIQHLNKVSNLVTMTKCIQNSILAMK